MVRLFVLPLVAILPAALPAQAPTASDETVTVPDTGGEREDAAQPDLDAVEQRIVERTNAFRKEHDREPVEADETLTKVAEEFARYMAETGRYSHEADGRTPDERVAAAGLEFCVVRENIAYAFRSDGFSTERIIERFVTGWKESPGHRRNMLARYVTQTGVAIAKSEKSDVYYAVQLFARPKSAAYTFEVANASELTVSYRLGERTFPLPPRVVRTHTECRPRTVRFLAADGEREGSDPPAIVAQVEVAEPRRLTVEPADEGYRVTVGELEPGAELRGHSRE
ncbi:MAG TPA: CAP domain-containing protein [Planctomycetaceae bacterium]